MSEEKPYDPLNYETITDNLVRRLLDRAPVSLPPGKVFSGPGIYLLYYKGDFAPYGAYRFTEETQTPVYVGKAMPEGARKGGGEFDLTKKSLHKRLKEHARSVEKVENLVLEDFQCRYLVVEPVWIPLAERFLIQRYQPIWNVCIDGFGIHDPGGGRRKGAASWWDVLHPGRPWAGVSKEGKTPEAALEKLQKHTASE